MRSIRELFIQIWFTGKKYDKLRLKTGFFYRLRYLVIIGPFSYLGRTKALVQKRISLNKKFSQTGITLWDVVPIAYLAGSII